MGDYYLVTPVELNIIEHAEELLTTISGTKDFKSVINQIKKRGINKKDSENYSKGQITGSYKKPHVDQTLDELQMWERQQGR